MMMYIYELEDWPNFTWDYETLVNKLAEVRLKQGRLLGRMEAVGFSIRDEAVLHTLTVEIVKSNEIEGEKLDTEQVRSSIARRLGMDVAGIPVTNRNIDGVVEMMLDATQNYDKPLTKERLFGWQAALFPTGYSGMYKVNAGAWRTDSNGPMQVVSGRIGRFKVHFEAPPAVRIDKEMETFFEWFNRNEAMDMILKAAIAHLWFVTIHPFEDGNGRIARAITDMALAKSENSPYRFYSMSAQIKIEDKMYYEQLEFTQKDTLDITEWLVWFLDCLNRVFDNVESTLDAVLSKTHFWQKWSNQSLNERQVKMLNKIMDGFEGKLTTTKWAKIMKCSQDTALRDIGDLVKRGILVKTIAGGRSTSYEIKTE